MGLIRFLALPPTVLLLLVTAIAAEDQWPHNLPKHMKYFPEDEAHVKRSLGVQEKLKREKPIGVKKMSDDEGEMFFLDNWIFASDLENLDKRSASDYSTNSTLPFTSPFRPVSDHELLGSAWWKSTRNTLAKRDFQCPTDTTDCSSIGAPNSCCATGSTCITIEDNGFGSVGCCPNGQSCSGSISCDTGNGYTSCPNSPNGGCCIPGYRCQDVGCRLMLQTHV
jgi:progranulin